MNKQEVINGLNAIRHDMEKEGNEYYADVVADATFRLIHSSIEYE